MQIVIDIPEETVNEIKGNAMFGAIPSEILNPYIVKCDDLPSVEPVDRWIPVSERLPEDGTYLVTLERFYDGSEPRINMRSFAKDLNKVNKLYFPKHKCGWYDYDSEYGYWEDTGVIAWMPLPPCYKPQEREEQA